jgi:L-arabinose isomerase
MKSITPVGDVSHSASRHVRPRVGLLPTGHHYYWDQFPDLKRRGMRMYDTLTEKLTKIGEIVAPDLVDDPVKAGKAAELFRQHDVDMVLIFPLGYTPSMQIVPVVRDVSVPIRILNAHEDSSYDYAQADTATYLHHEGVCCVPEYASALANIGRQFKIRTGHFDDPRLLNELGCDFRGAAAAKAFRNMNVGLIGELYTHMTDMSIDENRMLKVTGKMLKRPEVEEIENAFSQVTEKALEKMFEELRVLYDVDESVTNDHLRFSAQAAIAYEEVILRHDIRAFGYYWWGERELVTQLRAQSNLAVSRLAALGRPGVTEGDVKSAMGMKIMDLLGAGGMFVEFFSMDFDRNFILFGHDGPGNINMADGRPKLQHLQVHHGKSGHGLGIDFQLKTGPVTLLNITQNRCEEAFKLVYTVAEIVPGPTLRIGNPNCRVAVTKPIHRFIDDWCQEGPSHHLVLGYGDQGEALEIFAEALRCKLVRV